MQYKLFALSALAATVSAQASSSGLNQASVYAVLATALPSSLVAEALTNPGAVSSEIASEFSAGTTPSWFTALPTPIQTYLLGQGGASNATGALNSTAIGHHNGTASTTKTKPVVVTTHQRTTHLTGGAHTTAMNTNTQAGASSSPGASSSSSSGGASMPTAIIGAGLAGAVGFVGLLAL